MENNDNKTRIIIDPVIQESKQVVQQTETVHAHTEKLGARTIVITVFGLVEILITLRFLLKLFGANPESTFVKILNGITGVFVYLFKGIFAERPFGSGYAVFEPASIVAIIVVAIIAWVVLRLLTNKNNKHVDQTSFASGTKIEK